MVVSWFQDVRDLETSEFQGPWESMDDRVEMGLSTRVDGGYALCNSRGEL